MAGMAPRADGTVELARAGAPTERADAPWSREEDAALPQQDRGRDPGSLAILMMRRVVLAAVAVAAYLLGWVRV